MTRISIQRIFVSMKKRLTNFSFSLLSRTLCRTPVFCEEEHFFWLISYTRRVELSWSADGNRLFGHKPPSRLECTLLLLQSDSSPQRKRLLTDCGKNKKSIEELRHLNLHAAQSFRYVSESHSSCPSLLWLLWFGHICPRLQPGDRHLWQAHLRRLPRLLLHQIQRGQRLHEGGAVQRTQRLSAWRKGEETSIRGEGRGGHIFLFEVYSCEPCFGFSSWSHYRFQSWKLEEDLDATSSTGTDLPQFWWDTARLNFVLLVVKIVWFQGGGAKSPLCPLLRPKQSKVPQVGYPRYEAGE